MCLDPKDMHNIKEVVDACEKRIEERIVELKKEHEVDDSTKVCGIIDTQNDVGGWPILKSTPAQEDTDHDGMPDYWEDKNKLDPNNAEDRNNIAKDGYTMLEKYINNIK